MAGCCYYCKVLSYFSVSVQPKSCVGRFIFEVSGSHTIRHTKRYDHSERVISSSQRPLPEQHTTHTRDENPCPERASNPQSQHSSYHRPAPNHRTTIGKNNRPVLPKLLPKLRIDYWMRTHYVAGWDITTSFFRIGSCKNRTLAKIYEFDACVTAYHWYNNINNGLDTTMIILLTISISSTWFGRLFRPSSGALDCVHSLWYKTQTMLPAGSIVDALYHKL